MRVCAGAGAVGCRVVGTGVRDRCMRVAIVVLGAAWSLRVCACVWVRVLLARVRVLGSVCVFGCPCLCVFAFLCGWRERVCGCVGVRVLVVCVCVCVRVGVFVCVCVRVFVCVLVCSLVLGVLWCVSMLGVGGVALLFWGVVCPACVSVCLGVLTWLRVRLACCAC